jgi:amino acid transporter
MDKTQERPASGRNQFGTIGGVFTPTILTILGVIMFMRANFVVGHRGVFGALLILLVAKSITLATSLSISAISTNMQVRGGGAYYLISRVLGPEFGGAIGIALFLAVALSAPFYVLGFAEALVRSHPSLQAHFATVTYITAAVLFVISFVGAGWAIKTQYVIMAFLALAIVAFMGGQLGLFSFERLAENWRAAEPGALGALPVLSFWTVFAIYFPAVTGVGAGLNMSGDLKEPARSIPRGTLAAVGVGFVVYLLQIVLSGGAYTRYEAGAPNMIDTPFDLLRDNALWGMGTFVTVGVYAATLSSAIGCFLGAPRILQAVARDGILSSIKVFAKGTPKRDEPRRALLLTGALTVAFLFWASVSPGDALNAAAAVISMFFLLTYGMINAAAFFERIVRDPSFRPRFRFFHWSIAALGAAGSVAAAFLISAPAAATAVVLVAALFWQIRRKHLTAHFGDARRGFFYSAARRNLVWLSGMKEDPRNWRPAALVFSGNPSSREVLLSYAVWLEAGHGFVFLASVLEGKLEDLASHRRAAIKQLTDFCQEKNLAAFPLVVVAKSREEGMSTLLQSASVGPVRPNMAVFGWCKDPARLDAYRASLRAAAAADMGRVLIEERGMPPGPTVEKRIDVWWRGHKNGGLMLLLAHLLTTNWEWAGTEIRVLRVVESDHGQEPAVDALDKLAADARLEATSKVIVTDKPFVEVLKENSSDATCVFMGFENPKEDVQAEWHAAYDRLLEGLPTTILVSSLGTEDVMA